MGQTFKHMNLWRHTHSRHHPGFLSPCLRSSLEGFPAFSLEVDGIINPSPVASIPVDQAHHGFPCFSACTGPLEKCSAPDDVSQSIQSLIMVYLPIYLFLVILQRTLINSCPFIPVVLRLLLLSTSFLFEKKLSEQVLFYFGVEKHIFFNFLHLKTPLFYLHS